MCRPKFEFDIIKRFSIPDTKFLFEGGKKRKGKRRALKQNTARGSFFLCAPKRHNKKRAFGFSHRRFFILFYAQQRYHVPELKREAFFHGKIGRLNFRRRVMRGNRKRGDIRVPMRRGSRRREDKVTSDQDASIPGSARGRITP